MVRKLFEAGTYEEQPFYSLERVPKPRENEFGTRYLVKLAVAGTVHVGTTTMIHSKLNRPLPYSYPYITTS